VACPQLTWAVGKLEKMQSLSFLGASSGSTLPVLIFLRDFSGRGNAPGPEGKNNSGGSQAESLGAAGYSTEEKRTAREAKIIGRPG